MLKYILATIIVIALFVVVVIKEKISKNVEFILKTVLIVCFLEVTVFNINSYRTDFGNLKYMEIPSKIISQRINNTIEKSQYISIENIDAKVKSIYLELENLEEKQVVDYDIYYSDSSTSNRYLASKSYCQDVEKTKYSTISLSRRL